jgi:hypothetical protein
VENSMMRASEIYATGSKTEFVTYKSSSVRKFHAPFVKGLNNYSMHKAGEHGLYAVEQYYDFKNSFLVGGKYVLDISFIEQTPKKELKFNIINISNLIYDKDVALVIPPQKEPFRLKFQNCFGASKTTHLTIMIQDEHDVHDVVFFSSTNYVTNYYNCKCEVTSVFTDPLNKIFVSRAWRKLKPLKTPRVII